MTKTKRNIILIILSMSIGNAYLAPMLRFSFYDQMLAALQLNDIQLGYLGSAYGVACVICYPLSGILAEKMNTKLLLILSSAGMCLLTVWYATLPGYPALIIIHGLYGMFSVGTLWSPYVKAIRNLGTEKEQGRLFGISEGIRGIGQTVIAFICLAVVAEIASVQASFRVVLMINVAVFALLMVAIIVLMPDIDKEPISRPEARTVQADTEKYSLRWALTHSCTWICIFVVWCGYTIWTTVNGYMGTYCTRVLQMPAELSSAVSIIRTYIIVFVAGVTGGILLDKFKRKGSGMLLFFLLATVSTAGIWLTSNMLYLCLVITIVLSYLVNAIKSTYFSILGEAGVPLAATGITSGVISFIAFSPDIYVTPLISRFIRYGEAQGNVELGFNLMLA